MLKDIRYLGRNVEIKRDSSNPTGVDVGTLSFTAGSEKAKAAGREAARSKRHMGVQQSTQFYGRWTWTPAMDYLLEETRRECAE